jgi:predicted O-methyltransferase YrrM
MLNWEDDVRFVLGGVTFQTVPPEEFMPREVPGEGEFAIFKSPALVEHYAALVTELRPQRVFELGISMGGSTVFFTELARPRRLVAIDLRPREDVIERIERLAADRGLSGALRTVGEVDQADRPRLAQIIEEEFDGSSLDLVVDDCSHMYEPTRASFNELFPRLRPGGVYVIEDWAWAHNPLDSDHPEGWLPDEVPLTRLLFEIGLAIPSVPGLIKEISIDGEAAVITRGDAEVDPSDFDISACSSPRGQALLAPTILSSTET